MAPPAITGFSRPAAASGMPMLSKAKAQNSFWRILAVVRRLMWMASATPPGSPRISVMPAAYSLITALATPGMASATAAPGWRQAGWW